MPPWYIYNSGFGDPAENMAVDEALLEFISEFGAPVLRFYSWKIPAATFGYFQRYQEVAAATALRPLLRRPTGGGIVPHAGDWTYTLAFPPEDPWYELKARESYQRVHLWVAQSLQSLGLAPRLATHRTVGAVGQCFAGTGAEQHDVLMAQRKIAGAAQRRNRAGLLVQGSVQPMDGWPRIEWEQQMQKYAEVTWDVKWESLAVPKTFHDRVLALVKTKYTSVDYNQRR